MREEFLRTAIHFLAAALLACNGEDVSNVARRPDASPAIETVLLISIDGLRGDRLGVYGHPAPTGPRPPQLASLGLLFKRAYSTTSEKIPNPIELASAVCARLDVDCGWDGIGDSFAPDSLEQNPPARRHVALAERANPFLKLDRTARVDPEGTMLSEDRSGRMFYSSSSGPAAPAKSIESHAQTLEQLADLGRLSGDTAFEHSPGLMHGADSSPPKRLPNIVLIISDDQSLVRLWFHGE